MKKLILTDCDGVLCNWAKSMHEFMLEKGYEENILHRHDYHISLRYGISSSHQKKLIREFNESKWIENLSPFADSVKYVKLLANEGFRFIVVTSVSDAPQSKLYRMNNLLDLFGDVFDEVSCLPLGINKYEELLRWEDSGYFWIEDHENQAEAGHKAGLRSILINHPYNLHYEDDLFPRVSNHKPWEEIYYMVLKEYNL